MKAKTKQANNSNSIKEESIDQVRDILFGGQVRDFEVKFTKLEEKLDSEIKKNQEKTSKRFDSLEKLIKKEIKSLKENVITEQNSREDAIQDLTDTINSTSHALEKEIGNLDEKTEENENEIRQNILEQIKSLSDEFQKSQESLLASLEQKTNDLQQDKTDREMMAKMFSEFATRLSEDPKGASKSK